MNKPRADLRRYSRVRVAWKIMVEVAGERPRLRQTVDLSPLGVKVRLDERLPEGARARLRFETPDRRPLQIDAILWRQDAGGPVFLFVGLSEPEFGRLKTLVDAHGSL